VADAPKRNGSLQRVRAYLTEHLLDDQIIEFETPTKTAQQAADAAGCELGQIVKSLVFVVGETPVLVLVAGDRRGDADAIAEIMGGSEAHFADAETVRAATGFAIGGVSPFALPDGLAVLVDDSLERFETVYPAAGTPSSMVEMRRTDLLDLAGGRVARVSL
jgi:prolyl-tRNA editing enzyme YbaK/EbsC (Cys-tRNA(Pro) deacylase)